MAAAALRRASPAPSRRSSCWWAPTKNAVGLAAAPAADARRRRSQHVPSRRRRCPTTTRWSRCSPRWRDARRSRRPSRRIPPTSAPTRRGPRRPALAVRTVHPHRRHRLAAHVVLLAEQGRGGQRRRRRRRQRARGGRPRTTSSSTAVDAVAVAEPGRRRARRLPSPMAELPVGATFGSLVHAVLEHTDPAAPDLRAELLGHIDDQLGWWPVDARPRGARRRAGRGVRLPARAARRRPRCARSPLPDRLREMDFELPLAGGDVRGARRRRTPRRPGAAARAAPARRATRCAPTPTRCAARPRRADACAATSPARSTSCCGCPAGRATWSSTTRPTGSGPIDEPLTAARLPPRGAGRGDGPLRLPAAGAALRRGAAPLPALAAARLRPRAAPRRGALPLPARHVRPRHPAGRRRSRAASSPGGRRSPWSRRCPTCSTVSCPAGGAR